MKPARRRTFGLTASFAVHALAFAVLTPVVAMHVRTRVFSAADETVMQVELLRLRDGLGRSAPKAPDQAEVLTPSNPGAPSPPPPPPPPSPDQADESAPVGVVAQTSALDLDPLFRVPFRDAIGQAEAALRAGLGCAHVDLEQLPRAILERCAAADERLRLAKTGGPTPESPPAARPRG